MKKSISLLVFCFFFLLPGISQSQPITIDGQIESEWEKSARFQIQNLVKNFLSDDGPSEDDLSAYFKALWDADYLYLLIVGEDDNIYHGISSPDHHNDNVEVYLDINNSKHSIYDDIDDDQVRFIPGVDTVNSKSGLKADDINFAYTTTDTGYIFEIAFPWEKISAPGFSASNNVKIGLDVMITDNDGSDKKDYILAWNSESNNAYRDASIFGTMLFNSDGSMEDISHQFEAAEHDDMDIDESRAQQVIYVNPQDPNASDTNTGLDPGNPLLTVNRAIEIACDSAGMGVASKILLSNGIYREHGLTFRKSGNPDLFMNTEIIIEGEEAGRVIITGSELLNEGWKNEEENSYSNDWNYNFESYLAWGEHGPPEMIGRYREMIFVDGQPMKQVLKRSDLKDNSFLVDTETKKIIVKVADSIDFIGSDKEIAVHGDDEELSWPPDRLLTIPADKDKVVLRNLVFQHASMRLSEAALRFNGWKILMENCRIQYSNGHGLAVSSDSRFVSIENSSIDHNGGCGIFTWGTRDFLCKGSTTSYNNWRGGQGGLHSYSLAGIKFHHSRNIKLSNHVAERNSAPGLWTDLEIINAEFDSCRVANNYGPGFLIEISADIKVMNSYIYRNIPGVRCHSSHDVMFDNCKIEGNFVQFNVYRDHRNFSSSEWTSQFEGRVWDKTPYNWTIKNTSVIAVDDPQWQSWAEKRMPFWMYYEDPGFQPFWHFSHDDFKEVFFKDANIAYQNNEWIHPVTDTPFRDNKSNRLNTQEWEEWISGIKKKYDFIEILDSMAIVNDASSLSSEMFIEAGFDINDENLDVYRLFVEQRDGIQDQDTLISLIKKADAFVIIRGMALNSDASGLDSELLDDCDLVYNPELIEEYRMVIAAQDDLTGIEEIQALLNTVSVGKFQIINDLRLYPNPAGDYIFVPEAGGVLEIMNIQGKVYFRTEERMSGKVDVREWEPGLYILRIVSEKQIFTGKFIKE